MSELNRPPERPRAKLIGWRAYHKNTLRGFASVRFASGVEVHEIAVHIASGRAWASPPGRPWIDASGAVVRGDDGKIKYQALITFASHGVRSRWSRAVLDAVRAEHPEVLAEAVAELEAAP
jgi:hypothetical protein